MIPAAIAKFGPQIASGLRRNAPALIVRAGRLAYLSSAGVLAMLGFTAWKNQNNELGFFETLRSGKWNPEDADKPVSRNGSSGSTTNKGTGANGESESEPYSEARYNKRLEAITIVFRSFGLSVTSGKRSSSENQNANGVPTSLHLEENGALAFDGSSGPGPISPEERRAYEWAKSRPDIFQEVLLHNSGSGWHVHVAFRPGVTSIGSFTSGPTPEGITIR